MRGDAPFIQFIVAALKNVIWEKPAGPAEPIFAI